MIMRAAPKVHTQNVVGRKIYIAILLKSLLTPAVQHSALTQVYVDVSELSLLSLTCTPMESKTYHTVCAT